MSIIEQSQQRQVEKQKAQAYDDLTKRSEIANVQQLGYEQGLAEANALLDERRRINEALMYDPRNFVPGDYIEPPAGLAGQGL